MKELKIMTICFYAVKDNTQLHNVNDKLPLWNLWGHMVNSQTQHWLKLESASWLRCFKSMERAAVPTG